MSCYPLLLPDATQGHNKQWDSVCEHKYTWGNEHMRPTDRLLRSFVPQTVKGVATLRVKGTTTPSFGIWAFVAWNLFLLSVIWV